jgi:hypothetical protein
MLQMIAQKCPESGYWKSKTAMKTAPPPDSGTAPDPARLVDAERVRRELQRQVPRVSSRSQLHYQPPKKKKPGA